jgi:hypothetical protein
MGWTGGSTPLLSPTEDEKVGTRRPSRKNSWVAGKVRGEVLEGMQCVARQWSPG